jgi:hypothetical protein
VIKSRRMRRAGYVARMGRGEVYTVFLMEKLVRKLPLGRSKCRWKDSIIMGFQGF